MLASVVLSATAKQWLQASLDVLQGLGQNLAMPQALGWVLVPRVPEEGIMPWGWG